jgi:hypothetical protein
MFSLLHVVQDGRRYKEPKISEEETECNSTYYQVALHFPRSTSLTCVDFSRALDAKSVTHFSFCMRFADSRERGQSNQRNYIPRISKPVPAMGSSMLLVSGSSGRSGDEDGYSGKGSQWHN